MWSKIALLPNMFEKNIFGSKAFLLLGESFFGCSKNYIRYYSYKNVRKEGKHNIDFMVRLLILRKKFP